MKSLLGLTLAVLVFIAAGVGTVAAAGHGRLEGSAGAPGSSPAGRARPPGSAFSANGGGGDAQLRICSRPEAITGGSLHRFVAFPSDHLRFSFPAGEHIRRAQAARRLARVLCALPRVPAGMFFCPVDLGVSYVLVLHSPAASARLSIDPWGCEWVTGAISTRWANSSLWRALGAAIGLRHATRDIFAGSLPVS